MGDVITFRLPSGHQVAGPIAHVDLSAHHPQYYVCIERDPYDHEAYWVWESEILHLGVQLTLPME